MYYQLSETQNWFPNPGTADDDGLLAVGGDLAPERLMLAYQQGIFPWYSEESPILWYSPHERFVLFPGKLKVSTSMVKVLKKSQFEISIDTAFEDVIEACRSISRSGQDGTWITSDMKAAYIALHDLGHAHSVEIWENDILVGGLYGVVVNKVFCGESMFSKVSNASKLALISLCRDMGYLMIDCQIYNPHLESLGAEFIDRKEYLNYLNKIDKLSS